MILNLGGSGSGVNDPLSSSWWVELRGLRVSAEPSRSSGSSSHQLLKSKVICFLCPLLLLVDQWFSTAGELSGPSSPFMAHFRLDRCTINYQHFLCDILIFKILAAKPRPTFGVAPHQSRNTAFRLLVFTVLGGCRKKSVDLGAPL